MRRPPTACSTPRCPGAANAGGKCDKCQGPSAVPELKSKHDHHREWHALYNTRRWRKLRDLVLAKYPVCLVCKRKASNTADHVKDHRGDLKLFYDFENLRGVCDDCHGEKTGQEHGRGGRQPDRPGLVAGKVVDYAPTVPDATRANPNVDFLKIINKRSTALTSGVAPGKLRGSNDEETK